jgi:hypothetical protein
MVAAKMPPDTDDYTSRPEDFAALNRWAAEQVPLLRQELDAVEKAIGADDEGRSLMEAADALRVRAEQLAFSAFLVDSTSADED